MDVHENVMARTTKRSIVLPFLLILLVAVSILCVPACSSDNDSSGVPSNYIVQATVSVKDDGPVAYALVMDGDENLIDTLKLTINGEPMSIEYDGPNGESTETGDGYPYYTMDLPDLKGGDMVVFVARDQFGAIIYTPEPAIIPMAVELLEPQEGTEIVAGDEVVIRWTGGEGAELFSAAYAALDGSVLYWDDLTPDETGAFTVPAGQTVAGTAIVGVAAITGETRVVETLDNDFITNESYYESYFIVSRDAGTILVVLADERAFDMNGGLRTCPKHSVIQDGSASRARMSCTLQFAALGIGAIVWETRRQMDLKSHPTIMKCSRDHGAMEYCTLYGWSRGFALWNTGCLACVNQAYYYEPYQQCMGNLNKEAYVWADSRCRECYNPCPGFNYYCPP